MPDDKIIQIPKLALLVSKEALKTVSGTKQANEGEYRLTQLAEREGSSWYKLFTSQVEFADGIVGLFQKGEHRGYLDGSGSTVFTVSLYRNNRLVAAIKNTGANYLPLLDCNPEELGSMQRRLLALSLTGTICQELLSQDDIGKDILKGIGTVASFAAEYIPETARPSCMRVELKSASEMKLTDRLDLSKANVFAIEYR